MPCNPLHLTPISSLKSKASSAVWILCGLLCVVLVGPPLDARVVGVEVEQRQDFDDGRSFSPAGAYELLRGTLHYAVDPRAKVNQAIVDLDKAATNTDGLVRFSGDFTLIRPKSPSRRRGTVILEVPNRGRGPLMASMHSPRTSPGKSRNLLEDPLLLERGFSLLAVGWQQDLPYDEQMIGLGRVAARGDLEGLLRSDFVPSESASVMPLAHRNHRPYGVSAPEDPRNRLTVRTTATGVRTLIPRQQWRFARLDGGGNVVADSFWVHLEGGFEPGKIYEVVYVAKEPVVMGLGLVAIRDAASFFKRGGLDGGPKLFNASDPKPPDTAPNTSRRLIAYGASQAGRLLRQLLYDGQGHDEDGRSVFDGVWIHGAGAGRGSFNHRFAEPSRDGHAFETFFYPVDLYPFAGSPQEHLGQKVGLYDRWRAADATPPGRLPAKVFTTHSSYEYWGRGASLVHTSLDGKGDLPLAADERMYLLAGTQHSIDDLPPPTAGTRHAANPSNFRYVLRALLVALDAWVTDGKEPPPSRLPRLADGTLVAPENLAFPPIDGVRVPQRAYQVRGLDFGARFLSEGLIEKQPPAVLDPWPLLVPQVGPDGNEMAGIRLPEIEVPTATYTGWNLRAAKLGAAHEMAYFRGSFLPLQRIGGKDADGGVRRPSLKELYPSREEYLKRYSLAAELLVEQGFLLSQDLDAVLARAHRLWRLSGAS